jgi:hypothetical protein
VFQIRQTGAAMAWLRHVGGKWNHVIVPIKLGRKFNDHLPIFYFMIHADVGPDQLGFPLHVVPPDPRNPLAGKRIADQATLEDDFQFGVFLLNDR